MLMYFSGGPAKYCTKRCSLLKIPFYICIIHIVHHFFFHLVTCWNGEWDSASTEKCSQGWCWAHTIGSLTGNHLWERSGCRGSASRLMNREWSYLQGSAAVWGKGFCCAVETASPSNVGIRGTGEREFAATQLFLLESSQQGIVYSSPSASEK